MRLATDLKVRPRLGEVAAIHLLLSTVEDVFMLADPPPLGGGGAIITSGIDGKHMQNSKHYTGHAFDFRTKYINLDTLKSIVAELKARLGPDFDVIDEGTHLHVEWDPK